ncbi:hypothetical protein PPGU19_097990 (plasmid) [Paraburkholderia sp. PGU19]|nr:hypothetical protein PPGU19_097990 [Paraburkholderia sp. PGU19]
MLATKVGLVDTTGTVDTQTMAAVAAALNVQVTRDLPKYWPVSASVSYLADHKKIPQGVWPVQLVKTLPPDEGGFHMTRHNQPYAKVIVTPGSDEWAVDASHETIEMLIDPNGNRLQTSNAIEIVDGKLQDGTGRFEYLVEACDPCEADPYTYTIDGIAVSDFITPHYYDPDVTPDARYSFTGAVKTPGRFCLADTSAGWTRSPTSCSRSCGSIRINLPSCATSVPSLVGACDFSSNRRHTTRAARTASK